MNFFQSLKQMVKNRDQEIELLKQMREELSNQANLTQKLQECLELALQNVTLKQSPIHDKESSQSFKEVISAIPLLIADKTYNTSHPEYDANLVRNYPGRIFNEKCASQNVVFKALQPMISKNKNIFEVLDHSWQGVLNQIMTEVHTIPYSSQIFERKEYIEKYVNDLRAQYGAHYQAGWVNLEDALFLYWLVRQLKPSTIVQTGVCNGLSTAFMMLALVKNGPEGRLHVIDLPNIFDPQDPKWTVKGQVYGVLIPEGKSSGWLVPDPYRDRLEVLYGDAKQLLPTLVDQLPKIDMFYHDSDHTYEHMTFEFKEVKRKLSTGGLIVGDDISWNASVWDFADQHNVPSYNYKGAVGVAFF